MTTVVVFGGTGFLGRRVVARLRAGGAVVRAAARRPDRGVPAGVEAVEADVRDERTVAAALAGARAAVNAVALYVERGEDTFEAVHVRGAETLARCAGQIGLEGLVHVSGIGADPASPSAYVRARAAGEARVRAAFPGACILRPSVLFGPGDAFLCTLDAITRLAPVVPLFGAGRTRLQPVYVEDVAKAAVRALENPAARGAVFELGGPEVLAYREAIARVLRHRRRRRLLLPVPWVLWSLLAALLAALPSPPFTRDQLALMRRDNVADPALDGFAALGVEPHALENLLPVCLDRDRGA